MTELDITLAIRPIFPIAFMIKQIRLRPSSDQNHDYFNSIFRNSYFSEKYTELLPSQQIKSSSIQINSTQFSSI